MLVTGARGQLGTELCGMSSSRMEVSGCDSAALDITDINPLAYGLIFERFLTVDRVSDPDFDIDFCMYRREEVIDHVREKYGEK